MTFDGGIGDSTIEHLPRGLWFQQLRPPRPARNRVRLVLDLRDVERVELGAPTRGGLLDPTLGLRYSGVRMPEHWNLVLEGAVKIPVSGRRDFLSTGEAELGIQVTLQYFGARHAFYASASAVRYGRDELLPGTSRHIVPTAVFGVEYRWSERTHWLLQGYVSRPTRGRHETGLADLTKTKHQASLGVYRSFGSTLLSLAVTENLQHLNNTPDVGLQLGLVWIPALDLERTRCISAHAPAGAMPRQLRPEAVAGARMCSPGPGLHPARAAAAAACAGRGSTVSDRCYVADPRRMVQAAAASAADTAGTTAPAPARAPARAPAPRRPERIGPSLRSTAEIREEAARRPYPLDFGQRLDRTHDSAHVNAQQLVEDTDRRFAPPDAELLPVPRDAVPPRPGHRDAGPTRRCEVRSRSESLT